MISVYAVCPKKEIRRIIESRMIPEVYHATTDTSYSKLLPTVRMALGSWLRHITLVPHSGPLKTRLSPINHSIMSFSFRAFYRSGGRSRKFSVRSSPGVVGVNPLQQCRGWSRLDAKFGERLVHRQVCSRRRGPFLRV